MKKVLSISLKLNFTPNTLGCYELNWSNVSIPYSREKYRSNTSVKGTGHWKIELFGEIFDVEVFSVLSILNYALSRGEVVFTE